MRKIPKRGSPLKVEDLCPIMTVVIYKTKPMKGPAVRSCWRCNPAHAHLKKAKHLVCFICGREYRHGRLIRHPTS